MQFSSAAACCTTETSKDRKRIAAVAYTQRELTGYPIAPIEYYNTTEH